MNVVVPVGIEHDNGYYRNHEQQGQQGFALYGVVVVINGKNKPEHRYERRAEILYF